MTTIALEETVGDIVARRPALARVFEEAGIDYCCGGKVALDEACRKRGIDPAELAERLERADAQPDDADVDAAGMSLTQLADHIERTHHVFMRTELPRLMQMTAKVASVHGGEDARLHDVQRVFAAMAEELFAHMMKEERILFPMVRALDANAAMPVFHCGSIANPIRQMEFEHDEAGGALGRLRELTDTFAVPAFACNTYRAMLDALAHFERDLHLHIHKENNVLFPRAIELEAGKSA